jgi:hypothetical protein
MKKVQITFTEQADGSETNCEMNNDGFPHHEILGMLQILMHDLCNGVVEERSKRKRNERKESKSN